jgi:hypothetical protein
MNNQEMKLFAFQPKDYGQYSFFVMAANEKDAYDLDQPASFVLSPFPQIFSL